MVIKTNIKNAIKVAYEDLSKNEFEYLESIVPIKDLIEKVKRWGFSENKIMQEI